MYVGFQSKNIFELVNVEAVKFLDRWNLAEAIQYCMSRCRIIRLNGRWVKVGTEIR